MPRDVITAFRCSLLQRVTFRGLLTICLDFLDNRALGEAGEKITGVKRCWMCWKGKRGYGGLLARLG